MTANVEPEDHGMNCPDQTESIEMPSQTEGEGEVPASMECSGAAGGEVEMPSQSQTVQMLSQSQSQMSQGEDGLISQDQSVEMASQRSQSEVEVEMETECTTAQPLKGALENIDSIEFGQ